MVTKYHCAECSFTIHTRDLLKDHHSREHDTSNTTKVQVFCYNRKNGDVIDTSQVNLWSNNRDIELKFINSCLSKVKAQNYAMSKITNKN